MRFSRFVLVCLLVAGLSSLTGATATAGSRVPTVRDVWFTTTVTVPGQKYGRNEPEQIWAKAEEFTRGKDSKAIMIVVFNDHGSHSISGRLVNHKGKASPFAWSVTPISGATTGWRATSWKWDVSKLAPGKHTVELTVDSQPAGTYAFEVK
jgi:hypothetical protein